MGTVRFSTVMGVALTVMVISAVFGCTPEMMYDVTALTYIGKAAGIFGCQGSEKEPDLEEVTIMLPGDVPLALVRIPAGTFMMGRYDGEWDSYEREDPQHQVTLAQDFYMGKYELTQRQWQAVMDTTPWSGREDVLEHLDSPAVYVSWDGAQSFITALNSHITNTDQGTATFRLPTEAEWEYACRAGTMTRFYWGDDPYDLQIGNCAWYASNAGSHCAKIVGLKLPNAFGLYDMSGNVWEWCEDDWHEDYTDAPTNGSAWVDSPRGSDRVRRGGSWSHYGEGCRSARRSIGSIGSPASYVGFRLAR